ncbi:unnamed protein product, partial [Candidula unifasciata]
QQMRSISYALSTQLRVTLPPLPCSHKKLLQFAGRSINDLSNYACRVAKQH